MNKRFLIRIVAIITGIVLLLWILFMSARLPNKESNGFKRNWDNDSIILTNYLQIDTPLSSISGVSKEHIYIQTEKLNWILEISKNLLKKDSISLKINVSELLTMANSLTVDSPWIFLHANNLKAIIRSKIRSKEVNVIKLHTDIFTKSTQLTKDKIVIRTFDSTQSNQVFQIVDLTNGNVLKEALVIPNQYDAGFSSDGIISYDPIHSKIFYTQFYNNNFFCLDTNLSTVYTANTIDTTSYNNSLQLEKINVAGGTPSLMPSAARKLANKYSFLNDKYIFIESALKADNDNLNTYQNNSTIDLYELSNGKYVKSILIPHSKNKKALSYSIDGKRMIVLYKNAIAIYRIPSILGD